MNAVAVVRDPNALDSPLLDAHLNALGAGVQAVLHQLLDDGRGALHHFPGGDLIGNLGRQLGDAPAHRAAACCHRSEDSEAAWMASRSPCSKRRRWSASAGPSPASAVPGGGFSRQYLTTPS